MPLNSVGEAAAGGCCCCCCRTCCCCCGGGPLLGCVMGPFPAAAAAAAAAGGGGTSPGSAEVASGACSWSELGSKLMMLDPGELSANEHCVLQMLSLLTASGPNSKMSWGQLLIFRDWHWA